MNRDDRTMLYYLTLCHYWPVDSASRVERLTRLMPYVDDHVGVL